MILLVNTKINVVFMYLTIIFLPLIASIIAGGTGRFLGFRGAALITTSCVVTSFVFSCISFYEVAIASSPCYIVLCPWFVAEMFDASWGFLFDSLTVTMLVVVTSVSSFVHLYSISYMEADPHLPRFMSYLSVFTFFMLMLVTADNFLQMFLGWEGVGLASYLLINFWFTRLQANKAAIKAMLVNRVGDFGLALGIFAIFHIFKTVDFRTVFACAPYFADTSIIFSTIKLDALTVICCLLFVGAVGKSAQIGLQTWLPDAMEGPTPVSALIHAATMVTAGVFLIARCSPLFEYAPTALWLVTFSGAMTAFFAATTGLVQNDLKRVIAYSTCSQLGYMVFACGISAYSLSVFHLMNHAFFKALLFLSAGSVIHSLSDEQDMRKMGGIIQLVPFTYAMVFIGSLSLIGFPFLTGFYSKDAILEFAHAYCSINANFAYWLGTISVSFTSYYSFRLLFLTFLGKNNSHKSALKNAHDAPFVLAIPLVFLAFGSIFIGYLAKDMMIGLGTHFWANSLFVLPNNSLLVESEYIPQFIKMLPVFITIFGAMISYLINLGGNELLVYSLKTSAVGQKMYTFLNKRWLFDKIYNNFIGTPSLKFGYHISFKAIDKGIVEMFGPYGIIYAFKHFFVNIKKLQTGFIYHYALFMLVGLSALIGFAELYGFLSTWIDHRLYFLQLLAIFFLADSK